MQCKRLLSTLKDVSANSAKSSDTNGKVKVRELLSELRDKRSTAKSKDIKSDAFGIRQLVKARANEFKGELQNLTHDQFAKTSMNRRIQERFGGASTKELLLKARESPEIAEQMRLLNTRYDNEQVSNVEDDFQDFDDIGSLDMDGYSTQMELNPGDLVEYWPDKGSRTTSVILRRPDSNSGKRYVTLSDRGKIDYTNANRYRFIIPNFCDASRIPQTGILLQSDLNLVPARRALRSFKEEVAKFSTENARKLVAIYENLPSRLRDQSRVVSTADICKLIFNDTRQITMYAVFAAMTTDRTHFLPSTVLHMSVPLFSTRAKHEVDLIMLVTKWIRGRSSQYLTFINTAQEVAAYGRTIDALSTEALNAMPCPISYSSTDQLIITFMVNACLEREDNTESEIYSIPLASIVKDLGLFPNEKATRKLVHSSLKQIGILTPWDANIRRTRAANIPGYNSSSETAEDEAYLNTHFSVSQVEDLSVLGLRDNSDPLRFDFGDMPVYTIDGDHASELDDGISISGDWIHLHIADPSSYIRHDSRVGVIARNRLETQYLGDQLFPMLPLNLAMRHFSLGGHAGACPAMTTSVKLDSQGEIVDLLVRPSIIRNVRKTTYSEVDSAIFGLSVNKIVRSSMKVNWRESLEVEEKESRDIVTLSEHDRIQILEMQKYLDRARKYRFDNGMLDTYNSDRETRVQPRELPKSQTDYASPVFYAGRPGISTTVGYQSDSPATSLVTEAAILCNRAIAQYCSERKIPIIYRSLRVDLAAEDKRVILAKRSPDGRLKMTDMQPILNKLSAAKMGLTPLPADILGLPTGYTFATSPLRRYVDMVAQWQIQSFLLQQPYDIDLGRLLPHLARKGQALKQVSKASSRHWVLQLLQQKLERGEKMDLKATVLVNNARQQLPSEGMLQGVGERCRIRRNMKDPVMSPGSMVPVEIDELDLMDNVIYVRRSDLQAH